MSNKLKIAMLGIRGIPSNYGGFETCVEEVATRLAAKGHDVTVYCRSGYYSTKLESYKGVKLIYFPNIKKKTLETLLHTFICSIHALFHKYDVIYTFNVANTTALLPLLLFSG